MTSKGYRVQVRGITGCVVHDEWTDAGEPHATFGAARAHALEHGGAYALRIVGPDGTITKIRGQQATRFEGSDELVTPKWKGRLR